MWNMTAWLRRRIPFQCDYPERGVYSPQFFMTSYIRKVALALLFLISVQKLGVAQREAQLADQHAASELNPLPTIVTSTCIWERLDVLAWSRARIEKGFLSQGAS